MVDELSLKFMILAVRGGEDEAKGCFKSGPNGV
jgi:hypothetical protein